MKYFTVQVLDEVTGMAQEVGRFESHFLKNPAVYIQSLLDGARMFNDYGKDFTDFDMVKEVNGYLLNLEFKKDLRAVLKNFGQLLLMTNTAKVSNMTHFVVEGTPERPRRMFVISPFHSPRSVKITRLKNADDLKRRIAGWENYVRALPGVSGRKWDDVNSLIAALENVI